MKAVTLYLHKKFGVDRNVTPHKQLMRLAGTMNRKGEHSKQRPHRLARMLFSPKAGLKLVPREKLEALAASQTSIEKAPQAPQAQAGDSQIRKYLDAMPAAVQGKEGSLAALKAAQAIVVGFDIAYDSEEAKSLLLHYNQRCQPPWTAAEIDDLLRKLQETHEHALAAKTARGYLRKQAASQGPQKAYEPLSGPRYPVAIPDFELCDDKAVQAILASKMPAYGLRMLSVYQHFHAAASVPDKLVAWTWFGTKLPAHWRKKYLEGIHTVPQELRKHIKQCNTQCLGCNCGFRHKHYAFPYETCGLLDEYKSKDTGLRGHQDGRRDVHAAEDGGATLPGLLADPDLRPLAQGGLQCPAGAARGGHGPRVDPRGKCSATQSEHRQDPLRQAAIGQGGQGRSVHAQQDPAQRRQPRADRMPASGRGRRVCRFLWQPSQAAGPGLPNYSLAARAATRTPGRACGPCAKICNAWRPTWTSRSSAGTTPAAAGTDWRRSRR